MTDAYLPYGRQSVTDDDIAAVVRVLKSERLTTGGAVDAFEEEFRARIGAGAAVACANGTAALHLAALALGLGSGDHVVVPAITFLATANAVRFVGADVIFADVDPETGLMTPDHLEAALRSADGKTVRAVFPVHYAGQCGDPAGLRDVARAHGLYVVEDACHALGTRYETESTTFTVGSCAHADLAVFSFHPVKTITSGEGGMVTGKDPAITDRVRRLRNHGMIREPAAFRDREAAFEDGVPNPWYYEMQEVGFNYRLTDIQCALGRSQLARLDSMVARRAELVALYRERLAIRAPEVQPISRTPGCRPGWHLFAVRIDFQSLGLPRGRLMRMLAEAGIGSQVHYIPVHRQPYYRERYGELSLPGAEAFYSSCLSLPLFPEMTDADVERVVSTLAEIVAKAKQ